MMNRMKACIRVIVGLCVSVLLLMCSGYKQEVQITPSQPPQTYQLPQLNVSLIRNLKGHGNYVFYIRFSPDQKYLASGAADETIRIWELNTGQNVKIINEKIKEIWGIPLEYTPDQQYLVAGIYETLKVYNINQNYQEVSQAYAHSRGIQSLSISPDAKLVATAGADGNLIIWTLPQLEPIKKIKAHSNQIWSISISQNGKYLLSGGEDSLGKLWSFPDLKLISTLNYSYNSIEYVSFSADGKQFLLASADSRISVWSIDNYSKPKKVLKGHVGSVLVAIFNPQGNFVFSGGDDDEIYVFDVWSGEVITRIHQHWADVMSLAITPDGKYLASTGRDRIINIYQISN